jgi:hypothetical protein
MPRPGGDPDLLKARLVFCSRRPRSAGQFGAVDGWIDLIHYWAWAPPDRQTECELHPLGQQGPSGVRYTFYPI